MSLIEPLPHATHITVTDAAALGVPALVRGAEEGDDVLVTRRGAPVAYVVGVERIARLNRLEAELRNAVLVLTRSATDTGARTSLDEAMTSFGFSRAELEAELEAELDAELDVEPDVDPAAEPPAR